MEKCVKCRVQVGKFEIFPGGICVGCYGIEFQQEWESIIKVGGFK